MDRWTLDLLSHRAGESLLLSQVELNSNGCQTSHASGLYSHPKATRIETMQTLQSVQRRQGLSLALRSSRCGSGKFLQRKYDGNLMLAGMQYAGETQPWNVFHL